MDEQDEGQSFVTIYHGRTIGTAKMVGVTTDPATVALVARRRCFARSESLTCMPITNHSQVILIRIHQSYCL